MSLCLFPPPPSLSLSDDIIHLYKPSFVEEKEKEIAKLYLDYEILLPHILGRFDV